MGQINNSISNLLVCLRRIGRSVHLLVFVAVVQAGATYADDNKDFYKTVHSVTDQSVAQRNKAIKEGFDRLLVRLSGQVNAPSNPRVLAAKRHASTYVQEFRYFQAIPNESEAATNGESNGSATNLNAAATPGTQLELHFSERAVLQLLRSASLPFWPPDRLRLLLWLVADDYQTGLHWLTPQEEPGLVSALERQSRQFGVPMTLPLLDLQDLVVISPEQAWALDSDALDTASARYGVQGILIGRFAKTSQGRWRSSWTFKLNGAERVHDEQTETVLSGLDSALRDTMSALAARYAIVPSADGPQGVVVKVQGIGAFAAYEGALRYFEQLPMVRSLAVSTVIGPELTLTLFTEGSLDLLKERLLRDGKLEYVDVIDNGSSQWPREAIGTVSNPILLRWPRA